MFHSQYEYISWLGKAILHYLGGKILPLTHENFSQKNKTKKKKKKKVILYPTVLFSISIFTIKHVKKKNL